MSTINLSDLSVDNSGNTPFIIKDGKIQCPNKEIAPIYISETGGVANFTSSQIISMVNAGYLPYISLEEGLGLFKYYYYDKDKQPCVLFDLVNGREQQQQKATVSKSNNTRSSQTNTIPEDFIEYLNCMTIDWQGNCHYPEYNIPIVEKKLNKGV